LEPPVVPRGLPTTAGMRNCFCARRGKGEDPVAAGRELYLRGTQKKKEKEEEKKGRLGNTRTSTTHQNSSPSTADSAEGRKGKVQKEILVNPESRRDYDQFVIFASTVQTPGQNKFCSQRGGTGRRGKTKSQKERGTLNAKGGRAISEARTRGRTRRSARGQWNCKRQRSKEK